MPPSEQEQVNKNIPIPQVKRVSLDDVKQSFKDKDCVALYFPVAVKLTLDDHRQVLFNPGVNLVPTRIADHWYLKAHKVEKYVAGVTNVQVQGGKVEEKHVKFLQSRGYPIKTVEDAKKFVENLNPGAASAFFNEAAEWEPEPEIDFNKMTKPQLIEFAKKEHNLDLDPNAKKEDLISKIVMARMDDEQKS